MGAEHREGNKAFFKGAPLETSLYEYATYEGTVDASIVATAPTRATQPRRRGGLPAQRERLVGEPDVGCVGVGFGVDRHALQPGIPCCADDSDRA